MPNVRFADRALILVSGEDAEHFLQNILTIDLSTLADDEARPGALLTPQGKILFDFLVSKMPGGYRLDCRRDAAADFAKRLSLYKLRAKVTISLEDQALVGAAWDGDSDSSGNESASSRSDSTASASESTLRDARFPPAAGVRRIYGVADAQTDANAWRALRIAHGIAESGEDYALGDAFPHDVLLDQTGGVGFRKGCYVGQEVVSRMQHRGSVRTRIVPVTFAEGISPPEGTEALAGGKPAGRIYSSAPGGHALAMLRLDRIDDALAAGSAVEAGGLAFTVARPAFATFPIPGDPAKPDA